MIAACPSLVPEGEFLRPLLAIVDCHAQSIGAGGYQALAAPGSANSLLLAGTLTIFVALFGYRLLLGDVPDAREGVLAAVKIGVVIALATSWATFRPLVYDVALHGPAELASTIGGPGALPGSAGGLTARLQGVDSILGELQRIGTGKPPGADEIFGPTAAMDDLQRQQELARIEDAGQRPRWNAARDQKQLAQARTVFLGGAIGGYAAVRIVAGLLLAIAPLFVLFLLFDGTRGLFEGWVRGLAGAALGAFATALVLGVQLALMEPWLASALSARRAYIPTPALPMQLLVLNLGFALALLAALIATARLAYGFRMPPTWRRAGARWTEAGDRAVARLAPALAATPAAISSAQERSRATAVSDAVAATHRREIVALQPPPAMLGHSMTSSTGPAAGFAPASPGRRPTRRTRPRMSAAATIRDRQA